MICQANFAQSTFESQVSGSWDNAATWTETVAGGDADGIPDQDDIVIILNSHTITASSSGFTETAFLTINNGGVLNLDPSFHLRVWNNGGDLVNNGSIVGPGTIRPIFTCNLSGIGSYTSVSLFKTNTIVYVDSDISIVDITLQSGGQLYINPGNSLTITGAVSLNTGACLIVNRGSLVLNTTSFMTGANGPTTNLLSSIGDIDYNTTGTIPVPSDSYQNITISGSATLSSDLSLSGNFINNGTFTSSSSSIITFNGSSAQSISGSGTSQFETLILNNSAGLDLNSGSITIVDAMQSNNGTFRQNGASIILESTTDNKAGMIDVSSVSANYNWSSGAFTSKRFMSGLSNGWRMISSPIKNSTLNDVDDEFVFCGITGGSAGNNYSLSGCGGFYSVKTYNTSTDDFADVSSITQSISGGSGTLIYDGNITKTLVMSNGGSRAPEFDDFTLATSNAGNGYNVVSNPYPASLDYDELNNDNASINQTGYWVFSGEGGCPSGCGTWLSKGNTDHISQNQGFLIETSGTSLSFRVDQTSFSNPSFVKSVNGVNLPLKLKLHSHDSLAPYDFAYIHSGPNFSMNYDSLFEMPKLMSPYPEYVSNLYFVDNDSNLIDRICINNNQSVDLNFDVRTGQYVHGDYTIGFKNLPQFMIGSCLILEDLNNGILTDLRTDSSYSFTSDSLAPYPRFKLQINVDYDINVVNSTCFQDSSALISLTGSSLQGSYFNLIDSNGSIVSSITANQDSISFSGLNAGKYYISTDHSSSCTMTNQEIIIIEPKEVISDFSTISDTVFLDSNGIAIVEFKNISSGALHYNWSFGDGTLSTLHNPVHSYGSSANYFVELIAYSDSVGTCLNTMEKIITVSDPFLFTPSLENINDVIFDISNRTLNISFSNVFSNVLEILIYNIEGKQIYHCNLDGLSKQIDLNAVKSGIYFIRISDNTSGEIKFFNKFYLD